VVDEVGDDAGMRVADGLAYVCGQLKVLRMDLSEDPGGMAVLQQLLTAAREGGDIVGPLEALHVALQTAGDAMGVYGHTRGLRPAGVRRGPLELIYRCPVSRCSRYWWPGATANRPRCAITDQPLQRERL